MTDNKVKKDRDPIMMVCLVVFIIASAAVFSASIYGDYLKPDTTVANNGDTVTVEYTGSFYGYVGSENAEIFDTSLWSVANDDKYVKSYEFNLKDQDKYNVLEFKIGGTTVLADFGLAVLGHKVGDTFTVKIDAENGYPSIDSLITVDADETLVIKSSETISESKFKEIYDLDIEGTVQIKSVYGWPASAVLDENGEVTISYQPEVGEKYTVPDTRNGTVELKATSITGGNINYTYELSDYKLTGSDVKDSNGEVVGKEIKMIELNFGDKPLYITAVNESENKLVSAVYKEVEEKSGQDLYFEITLKSIN